MVRQWLMWALCGGALAVVLAAGLWERRAERRGRTAPGGRRRWRRAAARLGARIGALGAWLRRARPAGRGREGQEQEHEEARQGRGPVRVANSAALMRSPLVRRRVRMRRALLGLLAVASVTALVAGGAIAARPVAVTERNEDLASRDIVLCLDVSTSMVGLDASVLRTFSELLDGFSGERVALVAWSATAQTIVPLTDDYDMLRSEMKRITRALESMDPYSYRPSDLYVETFAGTYSEDVGSASLSGDGLASCTMAFDHKLTDRSRSIVLATDNDVNDGDGIQLYSLPEAAQLAGDEGIRLFSIYGVDNVLALSQWGVTQDDLDREREELRVATEEQGGLFYQVDDSSAASGIVEAIQKTQAKEAQGDTVVEKTDTPQVPAAVLLAAVVVLVVLASWRRA